MKIDKNTCFQLATKWPSFSPQVLSLIVGMCLHDDLRFCEGTKNTCFEMDQQWSSFVLQLLSLIVDACLDDEFRFVPRYRTSFFIVSKK